jgi:alkanesulfonate monooxygenase SsuD/methylene tetrahydromethanopterin reductase-like flavin-dependent oxidoreductase (luciferase family)
MTTPDSTFAGGTWPRTRHATGFGIGIPVAQSKPGATFPHFSDHLALANTAAGAGFDGLWFADHFSFPGDDGLRGSWDAWTLMAAIAASVPNVHIGPMVACTAYRNPGVIAKMTEMIQDISGGRFILGLGAGWQKDEYQQFGLPFEPRVSRFEEALRIIHGLLREGKSDLQGTYSQANAAVNLPRAESGPATPILVGSSGDRMLGLLARYGDAWDTGWGGKTDELKAKVAKLDAACAAAGRDSKSVVRSVSVAVVAEGFAGDPASVLSGDTGEKIRFLRELEAMGFSHLRIGLNPLTPANIEAFAPVIEAFHNGA